MAERKGIMLAKHLTTARWANITKPAIAQPKYNGNRCRTIFNGDGEPTFLSSSEAEITTMNHLKPQLKALSLYNMELDGELYKHGMPHQEINSIVRRTSTVHIDAKVMEYHIYDAPADHLKQYERTLITSAISKRVQERGCTHIKVSEYIYVNDMIDVLEYFSKVVSQGFEGIIIRDLNAYYVRKKCSTMLKFKPEKSEMFPIVGYEQGITKVCEQCGFTPSRCVCAPSINLRLIEVPVNMLGAVVCVTDKGLKFNIGGGPVLTKNNRIEYWKNPDSLVGKTAIAKFHEKSVDGKPKSCVLIDII